MQLITIIAPAIKKEPNIYIEKVWLQKINKQHVPVISRHTKFEYNTMQYSYS